MHVFAHTPQHAFSHNVIGSCEGCPVGVLVGFVGEDVGLDVGRLLGIAEGRRVGAFVGVKVGWFVGAP